jgi:hypothetical protein
LKEVSKIVFEPFVLASLRRKTLARLWRLLTKLAAQKQEAYLQAQMGTITGTVTKIPIEANQNLSCKPLN